VTVKREEVEHVARLAALAVDEKSLDELTRQIGRILDYVSQLENVADDFPDDGRGYPGPRQPLREDRVQHEPLALPLEKMAPVFRDGLFLVPRLGAVGDAAESVDDGE
jgi:aspartyl-tRNA(Asn)/glutamyl-tRNA(Gln) amidotransferase subunit C